MPESQDNSAVEELNQMLQETCRLEKLKNPRIDFKSSTEKGDGYLGIVNFVQLICDEDDDDIILNNNNNNHNGDVSCKKSRNIGLVVKTATNNDEILKEMPIRAAFLREMNFYESIYPALSAFYMENHEPTISGSTKFITVPRLYALKRDVKHETLILQNLRDVGYKMWDRKTPMNEIHVIAVLKNYAKLHAASFAMKQQKPREFAELVDGLVDIFYFRENRNAVEAFMKTADDVIETCEGHVSQEIMCKLEKLKANMEKYIHDVYTAEEYGVIGHGDSWCNNMMFKYEDLNDPSRPTEICLIDFQLTKLCPVIIDIAYFLCCCTSDDILNKLEDYLGIYYAGLCEEISGYGLNADKLYPRQAFDQQVHSYFNYGLLIAGVVMKLMLSEKEEVISLDEISTGQSALDALMACKTQNVAFFQRIRIVAKNLNRLDLL